MVEVRRAKRPDPSAIDHECVIVGAGFSGIGAGIRLLRAGIDSFVILEQASTLGGTWRDNTYPGIAVDITSLTYSFSFEPNPRWSRLFAPGAELMAYAEHCASKYGLLPHMRFGARVARAVFDEGAHCWRVELDGGATIRARFLISATGGLTQPHLPPIEGIDSFEGKVVHSARWDHGHDLRGRRVAVIGTGATAVQLVPAIAPRVAQLDVYQRTPIWILPKPDVAIPEWLKATFDHVPATQRAARLVATTATEVIMVLGVVYHRQIPGLARSAEDACRRHLERQVRDPGLRRKLTPDYGFGCKRPSFSNDYFRAFTRPNVELVTEPIARVTKDAIVTRDGRVRAIDTLVLATGFKVFERDNLPTYAVVGRGGVDLGAFWDTNRYQAYEGATVPGFPNFFAILGPYSTSGASWFSMVEAQTRHALRCIREARRRNATCVEIRQEPHDAYFADVLRRQRNTIFFNSRCGTANSYYFDRHGDAPFLRPSSGLEMHLRSFTFPMRHYRFESLAGPRRATSAFARIRGIRGRGP